MVARIGIRYVGCRLVKRREPRRSGLLMAHCFDDKRDAKHQRCGSSRPRLVPASRIIKGQVASWSSSRLYCWAVDERLHLPDHCTSTPPLPAMKLLSLITAALLPLTALAAKKPTGDLFQKYNAKQLSASGSFKLDDKSYGQLTKAPRDYSVAVLLTALEARFGCGLCNDFQPEYDLLARSWSKGDKAGEGRLLFATLDFLDGKAVFQSVCGYVLRITFLYQC